MIKLTPLQEQACGIQQSLFVEAGAGSGKTTILVERYLRILKANPKLGPEHVLALTFTEKAADEMLGRIQERVQSPSTDPIESAFRYQVLTSLYKANIKTIHGFCFQLLKRFPIECGIDPNLQILPKPLTRHLADLAVDETLSFCMNQQSKSFKLLWGQYSLDQLRQHFQGLLASSDHIVSQAEMAQLGEVADIDKQETEQGIALSNAYLDLWALVRQRYDLLKSDKQGCDFADILRKTRDLLVSHPSVCEKIRTSLPYIMVDEFQDTDPIQWEIISLLADTPAGNLYLVGDGQQSIYRFRGADSDQYAKVRQLFLSETSKNVVGLTDNFRSQPGVLDWVNQRFSKLFDSSAMPFLQLNPFRKQELPENVFLEILEDSEDEVAKLLGLVQSYIAENPGVDLDDIAVLCRKREMALAVNAALADAGISTQLGVAPVHACFKVCEDLYSCLNFLRDPEDAVALFSVLKSPLFSVSDAGLFALSCMFSDGQFWQYLSGGSQDWAGQWMAVGGSETDLANLAKAVAFLSRIQAFSKHEAVQDTLFYVVFSPEFQACYGNSHNYQQLHEELLVVAQNPYLTLADLQIYLENLMKVGFSEAAKEGTGEQAITCMTIHASKGLEFPVVFVSGLGQKFNFSSQNALVVDAALGIGVSVKSDTGKGENVLRKRILANLKDKTIEEEKRLLYVACTRAKDQLFLLGTQKKAFNPDKDPACFLDLIQLSLLSTCTSPTPD